jgi:hypothetical protein
MSRAVEMSCDLGGSFGAWVMGRDGGDSRGGPVSACRAQEVVVWAGTTTAPTGHRL